jgi:hypothetical protein
MWSLRKYKHWRNSSEPKKKKKIKRFKGQFPHCSWVSKA